MIQLSLVFIQDNQKNTDSILHNVKEGLFLLDKDFKILQFVFLPILSLLLLIIFYYFFLDSRFSIFGTRCSITHVIPEGSLQLSTILFLI